jgi:hypothetical protein
MTMARKPVHLTAAGPAPQGREAVWASIRTLKRFTIAEAAGYLACEGSARRFAERTFVLVRDVGVEAPRVRRDGTEVTQGRAREQMWRTMKIVGEFSVKDLAVHASTEAVPVDAEDAKSYVHYLHLAGYLRQVQPGVPGQPARYRFIKARNTGPKAPMVQRVRQVWDPNVKQLVWRSEGRADR